MSEFSLITDHCSLGTAPGTAAQRPGVLPAHYVPPVGGAAPGARAEIRWAMVLTRRRQRAVRQTKTRRWHQLLERSERIAALNGYRLAAGRAGEIIELTDEL